jgi:hypothetical protein
MDNDHKEEDMKKWEYLDIGHSRDKDDIVLVFNDQDMEGQRIPSIIL